MTGSSSPGSTVHCGRVLLIEDNDVNRALFRAVLSRSDTLRAVEVVEASTLAAARTVLERDEIQLVVLDVRLEDGSGLDLARELRARSEKRRPRVLVLSASVLQAEQAAALEAGADEFMAKPYRPAALIASIERLITRSEA